MTIHLFVIGQHPRYDGETEDVARILSKSADRRIVVARCDAPSKLVGMVRDVALEYREKIDVVDIFDHGAAGIQTINDQMLFDYGGAGREIAQALRLFLTFNARVRLLGCNTGNGPHGQALMRTLEDAFGGFIVVYTTIKRVTHHEMDGRGFRRELEDDYLFSSTEARTRQPPEESERIRENVEWLRRVREFNGARSGPQP